MFRLVIIKLILFSITLTAVHCTECKPHPKPCEQGQNEELHEEEAVFEKWARSKCPTPETIIAQADIDTYKGCIKKHVEPCIQGKEEALLKKLFVEFMDKFDLTQVCKKATQDEIEKALIAEYEKDHEQLNDAMHDKCSILKQAMEDVMTCAKIPH